MARENWPIPDIPGTLLTDHEIQSFLSQRVAQLCGLSSPKFPGSQPVSFTESSITALSSQNYWVCEKSDGVRVLILILMNSLSGAQETWLIDRKQRYFNVDDLHFPHWETREAPLTDTILDGELVIDIDPKTKVQTLRFYAFDALVVGGQNIMGKSLLSRFGRLREWVIAPFERGLKEIPEWRENLPFEVVAKKQELSYHLAEVLNNHIPKLHHGHDGLIFTCAESQYVAGTDEKILKWKPPSENSIDFKLELRFPPLPNDPSSPDYHAKPTFLLNTWLGQDRYEHFDELDVDDDEWEEMKESGDQLDDRIIECCWDTTRGAWRMMRTRDDKPNANHKSIVDKILESISDGVEIETLLAKSDAIRSAWKARESARRAGSHPQQQQHQHQHQQQQHQHHHRDQARPHQAQPLPPTPGARVPMGAGPVTPGAGGPTGGYSNTTPGTGVVAGLKR